MTFEFQKYQGAGNDFVMVDNRTKAFGQDLSVDRIAKICNRRFGIGADGLILLNLSQSEGADFSMQYFNSDGRESTMCGNGGRCIAAFAHRLGIAGQNMQFDAIDGLHQATILSDGKVNLQMVDIEEVKLIGRDYYLNTGSPHYVQLIDSEPELMALDVKQAGAQIRYSKPYEAQHGTNVNFISAFGDTLLLRTYERGVEDETLACGTGAVASAIVGHLALGLHPPVHLKVMGGALTVNFKPVGQSRFEEVWLTGPANHVFTGQYNDQA